MALGPWHRAVHSCSPGTHSPGPPAQSPLAITGCLHRDRAGSELRPLRATQPRGARTSLGVLDKPRRAIPEAFQSSPGLGDSHTAKGTGMTEPWGGPGPGWRGESNRSLTPPGKKPFEAGPAQEWCRSRSIPAFPQQTGLAADLRVFHVGIIHYNTGKNPRHTNARDPSTAPAPSQKTGRAFAFLSLCPKGWACFAR